TDRGKRARRLGMDGAVVVRDCARRVEQGAGRDPAAGADAGALFAAAARVFLLAAAAAPAWRADPGAGGRALVRRGVDRQSGVPAVLFHPRTLHPLPHQGAPARPAVVVLLSDPPRRDAAVDDFRRPRRAARLAREDRRSGLSPGAVPARLLRGGVRVLQRLRLQAAVVYPAAISCGG